MGKIIAMIPARMGSQRLAKKNLRTLRGVPLIVHAIRKCRSAGCFDEIWVNSEDAAFAPIAEAEGVQFHQRPTELGNNNATSEDFVKEFFQAHDCERLAQVHSIAPLLTAAEVRAFMDAWTASNHDVMLSCIHDQIEVAYQNEPVNFTFARKTNSQDLKPVQRITWSITGWKRATYLEATSQGKTATYHGSVGFYPVNAISGHVIKVQQDLDIAEALLNILEPLNGAESK
ncbi:MAG TPA: NTP transferase domain-containing protein [Alloacidobacterium sp.]|nr:NTP transferase domain-containing protein [Alloacidobacterium sp.]